MKTIIAVVLVIISLASAEPPNFRGVPARQSVAPDAFRPPAANAPYNPRGWRPQGAAFTLPKSQPQQAYGPPKPSYGPPPEEPTTTNDYQVVESTEPIQSSKLTEKKGNSKSSAENLQQKAYFVLIPQSAPVVVQPQKQNLVYAVTGLQKGASLVAIPETPVVPFAPLAAAPVETLPLSNYRTVYTTPTASYVQVQW